MLGGNDMVLEISALAENVAFVRAAVGAFAARLDPTIEELSDIKTAVSEAVTNAAVHAYRDREVGSVWVRARVLQDGQLVIEIEDLGCGIADVEQARAAFFTTGPAEERSGMGFVVMESFMDDVQVHSAPDRGTLVRMTRKIAP